MPLKYIFVVGGVLSGLGKGVTTSSIGLLLKSQGYDVTAIKIDPYLNVDAGTLRPTEHGEVWVTDDGGEIDQDLGNYERFLNIDIPKKNNITTGQIYQTVIQRERKLGYDGQDVQPIPDVINEIKRRIEEASKGFDFSIIEVGGTTGDIENQLFLHAIRELGREKPSVNVMVTYLPFLKNTGELKTKPTQHAVAKLREVGIFPDFIVARSDRGIDEPRKWKISRRCFLDKENIIDNPNVENIYSLPLLFEKQEFGKEILNHFGLGGSKDLSDWRSFVRKVEEAEEEVKVAIVGKYVAYGDAEHKDVYISIREAIKHASAHNNVKPVIDQIHSEQIEESLDLLKDYDAVVLTPGFGSSGVEGMILTSKYCRENNVPMLGICYGMQIALIEIARNVLGLEGAHSSEVDSSTEHPVIDFLEEQRELMKELDYGGTMRLGAYPAILKEGTKIHELYGKRKVSERHRHRYEVNPEYVEDFEEAGVVFSGRSPNRVLMEFMELKDHPYFVGTQAHPEFKSRPMSPAPLFMGLLDAAKE